jgi:uncharacterized membrane protein
MCRAMDWSHLQHRIPFEKNFRWRGGEVSRIEALTDAVFALSVTLLVVSTQVPSSYAELISTMKLFPAFALSFVLLLLAWYFHFIHFRRYGLEDSTTITLNLALLFVVLFYVYPLKFMFGFLSEWVAEGMRPALLSFGLNSVTVGRMLAIYGIGFALMYLILGLMGAHALRLRDELELNEVEVVMTRGLIGTHAIQASVGVLSAVLALALPDPVQGTAGFAYMLLPIIHPIFGRIEARKEEEALASMAAAAKDGAATDDLAGAPESDGAVDGGTVELGDATDTVAVGEQTDVATDIDVAPSA